MKNETESKSNSKTGKVFTENLQRYMKLNGYSQNSLAKEVGTTQSNVSAWIKNNVIPKGADLDTLANLFSIEVSELFIRNIEKDIQEEANQIEGATNEEKSEKFKALTEKYSKLGTIEDGVNNEAVQPLGRVLPGLSLHVIDLLQRVNLRGSNDKDFFLVCILLQELAGKKAADSYFNEMISSDPDFFNDELSLRKKQLAQLVCKMAGLGDPTKSSSLLMEKFNQLDAIEQDIISSTINDMYAKKKSKKSVS